LLIFFLQALENFATLRAQWETLTEKERMQLEVAEAYIQSKIQGDGGAAQALAEAVAERSVPGVYTDGSASLASGVFRQRNIVAVDVNAYLTNVLSSNCGSLDLICQSTLADIVSDLVPAMYFIASRQGTANSVAAVATTDLLVFLYGFPPANNMVSVLGALFANIAMPPTAAVAYHTASAAFVPTSALSGAVNLAGNWFGAYQSYEALVEYADNNGNGRIDAGEMVQYYDLSLRAWTSSPLQTVTTATGKVFVARSKTTDNVVTITCTTATRLVVDAAAQLLTPNSTKCSMVVQNFPYAVRPQGGCVDTGLKPDTVHARAGRVLVPTWRCKARWRWPTPSLSARSGRRAWRAGLYGAGHLNSWRASLWRWWW
jgi:hypothetical protein